LDRYLEDEKGRLLEHFLAHELHARQGTLWPDLTLFHYRTKHGAEVDFLLQIGQECWALEVKSARHLSRTDGSGLNSLAQCTPSLKRKIIIFLGDRRQQWHDVEVLPLWDFLEELPP